MTGTSLMERYSTSLMPTFAPSKVFVRGEGMYLYDESGSEFLDMVAGIACVGLGHANPAVASAIADQAKTLGHVSNLFTTPWQIELAEKLGGLLGPTTRVFFTNSGAESNEAAMKLTRLTGKTKIVAAEGSFHGRTMGALALTWTEKYRAPFEPLPGDVQFVPYGDAEALSQAVDDHTAAIILEPIQGESGVIVPPDGYLNHARQVADEHGALLWFDEVQSGMGRTGAWFAHQREGVVPDIVTLAKALGNGFPIGAVLATRPAATYFTPGSHGTTFGGNALACRVGLTVLEELGPRLDQIGAMGTWLADQMAALPCVASVRGRGLMIGVQLEEQVASDLVTAGLEHGIVLNAPRADVIRLVPPLIITKDDASRLIEAWPTMLESARHG